MKEGFFPTKTYEIPVGTRQAKGRSLVNLLNLGNPGEKSPLSFR